MTPETYNIIKFAIEQNNLDLVEFILKEDKLSDEQLSECLLSAKRTSNTDIITFFLSQVYFSILLGIIPKQL